MVYLSPVGGEGVITSFFFVVELKTFRTCRSKERILIVSVIVVVVVDQSGWGFTVKQGATTNREDSAA